MHSLIWMGFGARRLVERTYLAVAPLAADWLPLSRSLSTAPSSNATRTTTHQRGGATLFGGFTGIVGLNEAADWKRLASQTEQMCRGLVDDVIMGSVSASVAESLPTGTSGESVVTIDTVKTLDEISDLLCQTIDAAEFCRHVHHDPAWRRAAHEACGQLGAFVHELNTHYGMYTALCNALDKNAGHDETTSGMTEYRYVGEMLRRDFERFGVHLEGAVRDEMTELVAYIQRSGHEYMTNSIDQSKTGRILVDMDALRREKEAHHGMPFELPLGVFRRRERSNVLNGTGVLTASGDSKVCTGLLAYCDSEVVRKAAFKTYHSFPAENAALAEGILAARHRVAGIMGYRSFGAYQLDGFSLANTPVAVETFLKGINESIRDGLQAEERTLEIFKGEKLFNGSPRAKKSHDTSLHPWDRDWAINGALGADSKASFLKLHSLFRVSGFVSGMSALLNEAIGLRLVTVPLMPGEAWAQGISKVLVEDASSGEIYGTIYLDLLQRPGKFGGAALFTLRCGRRLASGEYQLPKVALVANVSPDNNECLSFGDLETLCHEFGHAMHSVLSRTELQHLSGTRGPQDIIEVPSHVFERFASDRRALSLMTKHSGQDANVITDELMDALESRRRHCASTKLQKTVQLCLLDQYMHGDRLPRPDFGSKDDIEQFMWEHGVANFDEMTAFPPLRFNHLVGYAGNYYSYLYAHCIAAGVWEADVGDGNDHRGWPSRTVIHEKMLRTGGSVPAKKYVQDLVGAERLISVGDGSYPDFQALVRQIK